MKKEDLERLKKVLQGTDFEVETYMDFAFVKVNDIWEGVEFCTNKMSGQVIKIQDSERGNISTHKYLPSTEQAYVNHLKAKAFELYGEIKDGDRFEEPTSNIDTYRVVDNFVNPKWDYIKHDDELFFYSILLYEKGQWAKKIPKRIEVKFDGGNVSDQSFFFIYDGPAKEKLISIGYIKAGEFLAKQLEEYLNK